MQLSSLSVRSSLEQALEQAARSLVQDAALPALELAPARNPEHGDYASPAGLKLAPVLRRAPHLIAAELAQRVRVPGGAATAEPVNGYVNFRLTAAWLRRLVADVVALGDTYGRSAEGGGERVQVEFVSVNPTGPLHIGHGRGAILGDTLARILAFTGHDVQKEYYVNDFGSQTLKFGESILARLHGEEPPEGGYQGSYIAELAEQAGRELPGVEDEPLAQALPRVQGWATTRMIETLRASLARLHVEFDSWFSEAGLWTESGSARVALKRLEKNGHLVERDGAKWFSVPQEQGADEAEDRVVIRRDGQPTYFASDLGYLLNRFEDRAFRRVIEVWGADHHGYVARMKAGAGALGIDPANLVVILVQIVHLEAGRMSKRQGNLVTLDELVDAVGADAVRYFYLLRSPESMMNFDLELARSQSNENPVYYAQYAYARLANVESFAAERELPAEPDLSVLGEEWELGLARQIAFWPEAVADAARLLEPHRIPYYVHDLADRVHGFYQAGNRDWRHRVVVDDAQLTRARVELCRAARVTLGAALGLMGVSAPERM